MPDLTAHETSDNVRLLNLGDSGSGKTGALYSLLEAGYEMFCLDFDNGLEILKVLVRKKNPKLAKHFHYETLQDEVTMAAGAPYFKKATAFARAGRLMDRWKDSDGTDYGRPDEWGPEKILVIDTLNHMGKAALRHQAALMKILNDNPWEAYGEAMRKLENVLIVCMTEFPCSIIVNTHIVYEDVGTEGIVIMKGVPKALGNKLGPDVPTYFNSMVQCATRGIGEKERRVILTKSQRLLDLKVPAIDLPGELPHETGLASVFEAITGKKRAPVSAPSPTPVTSIKETSVG